MTRMTFALLALACQSAPNTTPDTVPTSATSDTGHAVVSPYDRRDRTAIEDAATTDLQSNAASGVQIAVWLDGAIVYEAQFGSAHPDRVVALTPDTLFQIGSDTKKMTALTVLQQEQAGTLDRGDLVDEAIPSLALARDPGWAATATVADLITHQSGLFDVTPWDPAPDDGELLARVHGAFSEQEWVMNPPGVTWNYANPNFTLAGLAAEQAAGRPWADLVEDGIFAPLGMSRSRARIADVTTDGDVAAGRGLSGWSDDPFDPLFAGGSWAYGTVEMEDFVDNAFTRPAGLVWSTASEMARFGGFLIEGDPSVVDDARLAALTSPQVQVYPPWDAFCYGYGLWVIDGFQMPDGYREETAWQHGGNTLAMTSNSFMLPEHGLSISILSNGQGDDFVGTLVALLQGADVLGPPDPPPTLLGDETDHARLVGTYLDPYVGELIVSEGPVGLAFEAPDLTAAGFTVGRRLTFLGIQDVYGFLLDGVTFELVFIAEGAGSYRYARNRLFVGTRVETKSAVRQARPVRRRALVPRLLEARLPPLLLAPGLLEPGEAP